MITIDTHNIERVLYIIFLVATSKTIEAKVIAIIIPCIAEVTKAISLFISYHDVDD